jgi:menaquinone-dependent protoporphyrinogen oxidase
MPEILVLFASTHGHTEKVARRVAAAVESAGASVRVHDVAASADVSPADFDGVIVGASIHAGHHQKEIATWVGAHRAALSSRPSAFFSVCLTAAEGTDESRASAQGWVDDFVFATGWTPALTGIFAGALQYREYGAPTRLLMRLLMRKQGHPTDASRDYDYTDWPAVDRFGRKCTDLVAAGGDARAAIPS